MTKPARRIAALTAGVLAGVAIYDLLQKQHSILRNFPVVGHLRYWLEAIGPELRQYIVTDNDEERPFARDQRRWIYASSKKQNNYFGFGTDNEIELNPHYLVIKHKVLGDVDFPAQSPHESPVPCAKILGAAHGRRHAFRPASVVNISAMSFGSLSGTAVESLNRGALLAGCLQNTGEGGISPHHLHGGDLVWQIGTGYFGARDEAGNFSLDRVLEQVAVAPVRAIEVKLSQGAKAGLGGLVPAVKMTPEIAAIRGVPPWKDCFSPPHHREFSTVDGLIDFVEGIADATGLPVGIKSAVGEQEFWDDLVGRMAARGEGPDFVTIDGGEGGTAAAPLVFADHVSLPFKVGFPRVYRTFAEAGLAEGIVFIGSGKLGFPQFALLAMAIGCDMINLAREAMLAIGCIQAQRCHTGRCPTGVTTQSSWRASGLDPDLKSVRVANYLATLRFELLRLSRACGKVHPALVDLSSFEFVNDAFQGEPAAAVFGYKEDWGLPSPSDQEEIVALMRSYT